MLSITKPPYVKGTDPVADFPKNQRLFIDYIETLHIQLVSLANTVEMLELKMKNLSRSKRKC